MKDPLLNFIEESKESLDIYTPPAGSWTGIDKRLRNRRETKRLYTLFLTIAAVAVLFVLVTRNFVEEDPEYLATIEADSKYEVELRNYQSSVIHSENPVWHAQRSVEYYGVQKPNSPGTSNFLVTGGLYSMNTTDANTCYSLSFSWNNGATSDNDVNNQFVYNKIEPLAFGSTGMGNAYYTDNKTEFYGVDYYYEQYDAFEENKPETPLETPLSTFGIDVDGASYSNIRRFINANYLPPKDAVKLEEMINYFDYELPEPEGDVPFSITTEVGTCPWDDDNLLMEVALQGKDIDFSESKPNNLVFLIDVSGSMDEPDKLPLLKSSLKLMVKEMNEQDKIAIVVYAGSSGLALPATSGKRKSKIYDAIENLSAGGSTAGGEGIELAYKIAQQEFLVDGNNRIMLATDGDFNVGVTNDDALVKLIEEKRETGIFLSVLGFGTGNLKNSKMEKLADNGNGNYFYIDNILEAKKVLVNEIGGTMITIAKDVKLQVEFNPEKVKHYRLLGYENRILQPRDFDDDAKDAGELGSGHSVIALYEIVPQDSGMPEQTISDLRYQKRVTNNTVGYEDELAIVKFRYKEPNGKTSKLLKRIVKNERLFDNSNTFNFASAVAEFGLLIRESKYRGNASFNNILKRARLNKGEDKFGYRAEFIQLVEKAQLLVEEYYKTENYKNR